MLASVASVLLRTTMLAGQRRDHVMGWTPRCPRPREVKGVAEVEDAWQARAKVRVGRAAECETGPDRRGWPAAGANGQVAQPWVDKGWPGGSGDLDRRFSGAAAVRRG